MGNYTKRYKGSTPIFNPAIMQRGIFLLSLGASIIALMLAIAALPSEPLIVSTIQWASGNGDRAPSGCPMMEGYPCTYGQKVIAGLWVFIFMLIGGIFLSLGARKLGTERGRASLISRRK
ncbi:MAG: hypothetical protein HMLIMOIP_002688 [Candidatus Nitrosomirales archaeon]|jgi:hypothetical protein